MTSFLFFSHLILFFVLGTPMNEFHGIRSDNAENQFPIKNTFEVDFGAYSMLAYVPARICHVKFQNESGTFSPPASYGNMDIHLWCNWTILAGPGKHIVIYIKGFRANLNCDENRDEIIFEGVSSNVENSVAYACWNKHTHVYAAEATAVHVVFLWRSFSYTPSSKYFEGKYYVFEDPASRNGTRPPDCILELPLQEKVITPVSEPPTSAILDIKQDKSTPSVNIEGLSETESFEPSSMTAVKYQTFVPRSFDVTRPVEPTYSLHNIKESTQTINEESLTSVGKNGDHHSMVETHILLHKSGTTEQFAIPSSTGLATLEDSTFTSQVSSEEPSSNGSFPDQHENLVPSVTLHTSDVPYIMETVDLTPEKASIHSHLHPTEGGTTTMNWEEILVSSYGEHLLPETHFTSSGLYFKELKSTPVILHMRPEDASLHYSVDPIGSSTSTIKSEQFLKDLHDLDNFSIEATTSLSFAWHTGDKTLNKVAFSEAVEPSFLLFSTDHQERNNTSGSSTEAVSVPKGYHKEVLSETLVSSSILSTEDETFNPSTIASDLVTESEESSLALLLSTDQDFDQFLRQLRFDWDPDDILGMITPTLVATSQTDLKEATPKFIKEITRKETLTSEEVLTSTKSLQLIMSSFTFNHALLTKVMSKPAIPNTAVAPFTTFTASNEDLPQPVSVADALSLIPPFAKSGLDETKAKLSPMVTEAHQVASGDTNLLQAFLGFLKPFDSWIKAYKTEARDQKSIAPAISEKPTSHVAPSSDKGSKNNHFSGNILRDEQLKPPRIHSSQPTEDGNTMSNISDVIITTTRVIIEEMERSTFSYQSSDSNHFVDEDLRSDKVGTTTENNPDVGFSHADGLYAITIEIEHDGILSMELESKIIESTSQKIQEKMLQLPNTESSLLFKKLKRPRDNSLTVIYRLQMKNGGRGSDMADLIETQLNELINSSVATPNTTLVSFSIDGFHILQDHLEILIGSTVSVGALLLSTAVIVICIQVRKKRGKRMFSLQEPKSSPAGGQKNSSLTQSDSTLNLSKPTRCLPTCQPADHQPPQETTSVLELTKITVEQTAC